MRVLNIALNGVYTDGFSYHENLLPKYHKVNGHDVHIMASEYVFNHAGEVVKYEGSREYIDDNGIHIYRLPIKGDRDITYRLKQFEGVYSRIEEIAPDVIFCHLFQFLDLLQVVKYVKKNPKVKLYIDSHADCLNSARTALSKKILHGILWRYCAHRALPYTQMFYGVLPARVDFLTECYKLPAKKAELLVMGAEDALVEAALKDEVREECRKSYGFHEDDFVIITGGKIDHNKKQTLILMKAVNALSDGKIKLLVFGSVIPELREEFEAQLTDRVQYIGWKESREIYKEFAAADLVAFPGLHSVLWEQAVGMGKPCVFRRIPGFDHIDLGGNCMYFEDDSPESYGGSLLAAQAEIGSLRETAVRKGISTFSYTRIAKKSLGE